MTAPARSQRLLVCNCQRTMEIDGKRLAEALGLARAADRAYRALPQPDRGLRGRPGPGASVHVACTQEAPLFREVAADKGGARPPSPSPTSANAPAGAPTSPPPCRRWRRCWPRRRMTSQADRRHHAQVGGRVPRLRPRPGGARRRRRAVGAPQRHRAPERPGGRPAAGHRLGADLQGPHPHGHRPSRPLRDRGRRLCADAALLQGRAAVRHAARRRPLHLRHHLRHVRRHAAVCRCAAPRRLPARRPGQPGRRGARHVPGRPTWSASSRSRSMSATTPASARTPAARRSAAPTASTIARPAPSRPTATMSPSMPRICGGCGNCSAVCPTGAVSYAYPQRADLVARLRRAARRPTGRPAARGPSCCSTTRSTARP